MWKLCVAFILGSWSIVLGRGNETMMNFTHDSWIPDKKWKSLINSSFLSARCCNAYIYGQSIGINSLFNQFIKNYKFDYTIMSPTYACDGYFLISSTSDVIINEVERVIPTSISTTELLIIIDDELPNNSTIFDGAIFQNAYVNIVSRSEMWTLSENYLFPRNFKKISSLEELKHKTGLVNFQGRKLQVATYNYPPFCYLSTIENRSVNGIEAEFFVAEDSQELDGIEVQLFFLMAEKLNFTWDIRKPRGMSPYGTRNGSIWKGGMIGQVLEKEVDLAFGGIWLTFNGSLFVNLSEPWEQLSVHFLVPRPKPDVSIWALRKPLSKEVWLVIVVMVIIQGLNIHAHAQLRPQVPKRFERLVLTSTELMGRLVGSWSPHDIRGLRWQLYLWDICGILLVTAYCSSLASKLTTPDYEPRIDTIQQFVEANLTWGGIRKINFNSYFDLKDKYTGQLPDRFQAERVDEDRYPKIMNGKYAIHGKMTHGIFFPNEKVNNSDLKIQRRIGESGIRKYHVTNVLQRRTSQALREVLIEHDVHDDKPKVLELKPLVAGFAFLIFGLMVSTIVFYFEVRSKRFGKLIIENVKTIQVEKRSNTKWVGKSKQRKI